MPLGDSLTEGGESGNLPSRSYRGPLYDALRPLAIGIDFVGPRYSMPATGGDPDHAGYSGALIGSPGEASYNIFVRLADVFAVAGDPDIVVMMFGYNSIFGEPALAATKYKNIVDHVRQQKPNALIVVATLSPVRYLTEQQASGVVAGYADLNSMARRIAAEAPLSSRIVLADIAGKVAFTPDDYTDSIHLSQSGANKVAGVVFDALSAYYLRQN